MLNSKPDLGPLLDAVDCYGNPTPFIRYCPPPKAKKADSTRSKSNRGGTTGTKVATRTRARAHARAGESRVEESRVEKKEERRETKPLRVSRKEERERKERISTTTAQKIEAQQTEALEPEKPENPIESEAGSAKRHIMPKPARSANRRQVNSQIIGDIIAERFPDHWQDADAESFGWEIVRALGYSDDPKNLKTRSEWGAFAAWWSKVKKATPITVLDELRAKAIWKAKYLCKYGRSAKNKSAVWFHIMHGELSKRGVRMTLSIRASPSR